MSSAEMTDWQAYEKVTGPLGSERDDTLAAMTAFYVVSALGSKKARLDKLLPRWDRPTAMPWEQMKKMAEVMAHTYGR